MFVQKQNLKANKLTNDLNQDPTNLHANESQSDCAGGRVLTLACLAEFFGLRGVVSMLSGSHLEVQDTRELELGRHILQQDKLCNAGKRSV